MNDTEKKKYDEISKLVNGLSTRISVSEKLGISLRQVDRLKKKFKEEGGKEFIHKNRGKRSKNKIDEQIIKKLEDLYLTDFFDYSIAAFYDEIKKDYKLSYDLILRVFKKDDIISPYANHSTLKLYKEKMENAISENSQIDDIKVDLYKTRKLEADKSHIRKSSNLYTFGQEVQMDATFDIWFDDTVSALHLAVDKATKKILSGHFEYEEISEAYYIILYNMIINYGIPEKIKTDNRNSFSNKNNNVETTQFGMICNDLGIFLDTSSSPTFKANVERANGTFKRRLRAELRHENITNINDANNYLNETFIPKMNAKFTYEINHKTSRMRENNYSKEELNLIISERYKRIIDNASAISFKNDYYVPVNLDTGEVVTFMFKTECTVLITYNLELWCKIENTYYKLVKLDNRETTMTKENETSKTHYKYLPPKDHPWRTNMMLKKKSQQKSKDK